MKRNHSDNIVTMDVIEKQRSRNFRQLLLRTSRVVNKHVVEGLHARGYTKLRSTHTTLLSNMDLGGSTVTIVAERAGISKQAMGRLALELKKAGYISLKSDPKDARARILQLTKTGSKLMLESLQVMAELERRYARDIGKNQFSEVLRGLATFLGNVD